MPMPRVLLIDPNTPIGYTERSVLNVRAFFISCGCWTEYRTVNDVPAGATMYSQDWDLVYFVYAKNALASYQNIQIIMNRFSSSPVFVVGQAFGPNQAPLLTGVSAVNGNSATVVTTGLKNWNSRANGGRAGFYGDFPTVASLAVGVTSHADNGTHCCMWSFPISGKTVLFIGAQSHTVSTSATNKATKPWYALQYACDQKPGLAAKLRKRHFLWRFDGYDAATDLTALNSGNFLTWYSALAAAGCPEINLQATWSGTAGVTQNTTVHTWLLARGTHNGGLFRISQHLSDLVDGSTGGAGSICSSNGVLYNQFAAALTTYQGHCNQLTAAGWTLGTDGYGAGYIIVQQANELNNPTAAFLTLRGIQGVWVIGAKAYPSQPTATVEAVRTLKTNSQGYGGMRTLLGYSADTWDAPTTPAFESQTMNAAMMDVLTYGGGFYVHGIGITNTTAWIGGITQVFTTCPDVCQMSTWEQIKVDLARGVPILGRL